jgi:hypothetical protein
VATVPAQDTSEHTTAPNEAVKRDDSASRQPTTQVNLPPELSVVEVRAAGVSSPSRKLVPVAVAVAALLAAVGVLLFRNKDPGPTDVKPPAVVTPTGPATPPEQQTPTPPAPTPVSPNNPVNPTPGPTPPTPTETARPPDGKEVTPTETPTETQKPPPTVKNHPRPSGGGGPSQAELMDTVNRLERDMDAYIAGGQIKPDHQAPARNMFTQIRKDARAAKSASDRSNVLDLIKLWERTYLGRR